VTRPQNCGSSLERGWLAARDYYGSRQAEARKIVDEQAKDKGLWFDADFATEMYLQQELRRLHEAVESGPRQDGREAQAVDFEQEVKPCLTLGNGDTIMLTDEQAANVARVLGVSEDLFPMPDLPMPNEEEDDDSLRD
jgi:hypothetical protein